MHPRDPGLPNVSTWMSNGCPITSEKAVYLGSITKLSEGDWDPFGAAIICPSKNICRQIFLTASCFVSWLVNVPPAMKVALSTNSLSHKWINRK